MSDIDEDLIASQIFLESSRFWVQRVIVPIFVLIGVGGNIVTVLILTRSYKNSTVTTNDNNNTENLDNSYFENLVSTAYHRNANARRRMRCTTHIYLTALALADLIYLLFVLILSFEHYPNSHHRRYELYWRFYGITHWLCDAASSASVWLTVSFTIERYIIVCHPLRGKAYCTESRAKNIITVVSILCFIATASTTFEHQLSVKEHCLEKDCNLLLKEANATRLESNKENSTLPLAAQEKPNDKTEVKNGKGCNVEVTPEPPATDFCNDLMCVNNGTCCEKSYTIFTEPTELGKNVLYTTIFYWFSAITFALLPLLLIATFNCFLIRAVLKSTQERKAIINSIESTKQRNENRVTILLIGIVILFLICQTPTASHLIYDALDEASDVRKENIKKGLGNIFNCLVTLNASFNFLMYCVLSKNYRRTFRSVFCTRTLNRQDTAFSVYTRSRYSLTRNGYRRNKSEYHTPRNLETQSLNSIPRSKSLMMRPLGKARTSDLHA